MKQMKRVFLSALLLLLVLLLCMALFSCKKKPEGDNPKEDPKKEDTNQPDSPTEEEDLNPRKDGNTYRY